MRLKDFAKVSNTKDIRTKICVYDKKDTTLYTCYELSNYCVSYYIARYPKLAKQKIVFIHHDRFNSDILLNIVVKHKLYAYIENFEKTIERENKI